MPHEILLTEAQGSDTSEFVYIKPPDQNAIIRINSSLKTRESISYNILGAVKEIFLPLGYPDSVSQDYAQYQLWDTIQAFCSTISNTLTTQAILKGVGVGSETASSVSAAITWILKDGTGMVAKILFTWLSSWRLDSECKKWRLFADGLNDLAMGIELVLLTLAPEHSLYILCASTSMKALVGVAGGATRAAITQHQARMGNMGDVSAKDGSQETCVNLLASLMGVAILSSFGNSEFLWLLFIGMTLLHLYSNFQAVRSLNFQTLNSERLNILVETYILNNTVVSSDEINKMESVILGTGLSDRKLCGYKINMGWSLKNLVKDNDISPQEFKLVANIYKRRKFLILTNQRCQTIYVVLRKGLSEVNILEAYFHAVLQGIGSSYTLNQNLEVLKNVASNSNATITKLKRIVDVNEEQASKRHKIDTLISIDQLAASESSLFLDIIKKDGWELTTHHLRIGKWRGLWNVLH